jgi:hypothetical protein
LSTLSLSSTFMLASGILFILSMGFLFFHFSNTGKSISQ